MSGEEHARIGELIMKRQSAIRQLNCHKQDASRMVRDLDSAINIADGSGWQQAKLPGTPWLSGRRRYRETSFWNNS